MKRVGLLIAAMAAWLVAQAVCADTIVYTDGRKLNGTIKDVTFLANAVHGIYPRKVIKSLELLEEGEDSVLIDDGEAARKGSLVAVRLRTTKGLLTIPRRLLKDVKLNDEGRVEETKAEKPPAKKPQKQLSEEEKAKRAQKQRQFKNYDLRNLYWDKAGDLKKEEIRELKREYMDDAAKVVNEVRRIEDTIRRKLRRREDAERNYRRDKRREDRNRREGRRSRRVKPPQHNDGLEKDQQALREANEKKRKLQAMIRNEMDKISKRASGKRKRVEAVYTKQKRAIEAGQELASEAMIARYKAALGIDDEKSTARQDGTKKGAEAQRSKK